MTDFQKTEHFPATGGKEYRFVVNTKLLLKIYTFNILIFLPSIFVVEILTYNLPHYPFIRTTMPFIIVLFFALVILGISYYAHKKSYISVNSNGISSNIFSRLGFPKHIPWDSLVCVHRAPTFSRKNWHEQLLFTQNTGGTPLLTTTFLGHSTFVGDGHTLTLIEAIEQFHNPVTELSNEAKKTIPMLRTTMDLGKEVAHVVYAMLGIVILAIILFMLPPLPISLEVAGSSSHVWVYWLTAVISCVAACVYMRHAKEKVVIPLVALIFSGACVSLVYLLIQQSPAWFGEARQETFSIVHEDDKEQRWQGTSSPELSFSIIPNPERRIYQKIGTQKTLTIYQGPFGLNAISKEELQTLFNPYRSNIHIKKDDR
jgi:hypothetical protein